MHTRTTTALLDDLLDSANEGAWVGFDARYRPVLIGFARQLGLRADDAADIAQEALTKFVRAYQQGQYRRERGRLSSWLITIARPHRKGVRPLFRESGSAVIDRGVICTPHGAVLSAVAGL